MQNRQKVYLVGAGGFGREVESWISISSKFKESYKLIGYIDDRTDALNGYPSEYKVLGSIDDFIFSSGDSVLIAIADPGIKTKIVNRLMNRVQIISFISDDVIIGKFNKIGEGSIISPNVVLSTNVEVGRFVTLNLAVKIGHDAVISDYSSLMADINIGGGARIGHHVYVGSQVTVFQNIKIGENSKISAGSVIYQSVIKNSLMAGNPAKDISRIINNISQSND